MKRPFIKRALCALLILIFLFNAVSCASDTPTENNGRLEISEENIEYGADYIDSATERFSDILDTLLDEKLKISLSEKQREKLVTAFKDKIIPTLCKLKVYEKELDGFFLSVEEILNKGNEDNYLSLFSSLYESLLYTLGSERAGVILYAVIDEILSSKITTAEERYESLGNSWYLDDIERCEKLKSDLAKMGEKNFADIVCAATFILSTMKSADTGEESALTLSDAELLFILEHQGEIFLKSASDEESWNTIGRLITELIPKLNFTDVTVLSVLYALKQDAYFNSLTQTMPYLFKLYASFTKNLKNEAKFSLSSTKEENDRAICSALLSSGTELKNFYDALHTYGSTDSARLRAAVEASADKTTLDGFLNSHAPLTYEELLYELESCAAADSDAKSSQELLIGVTYSVSPYLAFILFG